MGVLGFGFGAFGLGQVESLVHNYSLWFWGFWIGDANSIATRKLSFILFTHYVIFSIILEYL
jgi:hypothetical protein